MPDLPSRLDLQTIGRNYVIQRAKRIDPAQADIAGSDINIFIGSVATIASAIIDQLAYRIASLFLDSCDDEELDRYAWDRYQLTRKGSVAAVGPIRVYRDNANAGAGTLPLGTKIVSLTGIEYVTTSPVDFGVSVLSTTATVRAVQSGKDTQVGANALRKFSDMSSFFDQTLQVNNDVATSGGEDAEEDTDFKARIRSFWVSARRGTLEAIEFGAKTIEGIFSAQAVEVLTPGSQPARAVLLYISDSSGVANQALASTVRDGLNEYRAAGISVLTATSIPQIVTIVLQLAFKVSGTVALSVAIRDAILSFVNSLPVNGTLYRGELQAVLARFVQDGLVLNESTIVSPSGDLIPDAGKSIRTTLANIKLQP